MRNLRKHGYEFGINQFQASETVLLKLFAYKICHLKAIGNVYSRNFPEILGNNFFLAAFEIFHGLLSNGKNRIFLVLGILLKTLEKIAVVTARKTSVTGDHHVTNLLITVLFDIYGRKIRISLRNPAQSSIKLFKIRATGFGTLLCPAKFGGCHKFHRLGNLHRVLNTFDSQLYSFCICSHLYSP